MKRAIIIGASSGIGAELAKIMSADGWAVGLTGRRKELLDDLCKGLSGECFPRHMDVSEPEEAMKVLTGLIREMGGMDLIVISAGMGHLNDELDFAKEAETIDVNVTGFTAMTNTAMNYFIKKGGGHLVAISSIAALRGEGTAPAYNASKAFVSNYVQGMRQKAVKLGLPITVTDIQPGFVDTDMAKGEGLFWVQSPQKAAKQIYKAIKKKKKHAYITKRWRLLAWLIKWLPDFIYNRM